MTACGRLGAILAGVKSRPIAGRTPRTWKNPPETNRPLASSQSPPSTRTCQVLRLLCDAITAEKPSAWSRNLLEFAVGEPRARAVGPAGPAPRLVRIGEHHQLLGLVHAGQRGVQHAVPQAEDRGVGADAERERQDGDGREARRSSGARAARRSHPGECCRQARRLAHRGTPLSAARSRPSRDARRTRASSRDMPCRDVVVDETIEMVLELLVELLFHAAWLRNNERRRRRSLLVQRMARPQVGFTTSEMAADRRSHSAVSLFRAFRPAAVSL